MTKGRDNAAENLSDVLELIRKRRQSGLLSVERLQGGLFEEGEIYFQAGQLVYARLGQLTSADALARLLGWRQVYFAFITEEPRPPANIPSPVSARTNVAVATDPGAIAVKSSLSNSNASVPSGSRRQERMPGTYAQNTSRLNGSTPGLEWLVPQKRGNNLDVLSLPLTRPQRSIYLLIDGKRTV